MKDKILTMFFDINRWTKAIEKGVLKDIRKSELIKLTEEPTRIRMAEAMLNGKYQITPPHIAQIPKDNGEFRTVYVNEPIDRSPEVTRLHSLSPQVLDQVIFIIIMRVK